MSGPTLSVVLPNYNHARYLREAIEGIVTQLRPPDEFLILDDASTDNSLEIIEEYQKRFSQIRVIRHERNRGVLEAHNRLFEEVQGDYIFAAAADDIRLPGFFEAAMELARQYPQAGLIFGQVGIVMESGRHAGLIDVRRWREPLHADPRRFLEEYLDTELASHSPCAGTIYRSDAFREVGCYRPDLESWCDTFAVRAIGLKYGVCHIPQEVVRFRKSVGSFSHTGITQPRRQLDVIARAAALMRSPAFRDRFPADHVRRWSRDYRRLVLWNNFLGDDRAAVSHPGFFLRNLRRLPRLPRVLSLAFYRPDVTSCNAPHE
jgi:glycosyltransferase involved in cell wall biosynthesis